MDERRFDDFVRNLSSTSRSRRSVLKGLMAGAVSGAAGLLGAGGALAGNNGNGNGNGSSKKSDCCPSTAPRLCGLQCVDFLSDASNCGGCGNSCPEGAICQDGACVCPAGTTPCDNVCVDITTDSNNCGDCGMTCAGGSECVAGDCTPTGECTPGETRTCGSSIGACIPGSETCLPTQTWGPCEGAVLPQPETCNGVDDDCDGQIDNVDPALLASDLNNCGACGHVCVTPNGTSACVNGDCVLVACNAGFADCNGNPADGCEVNVSADNENCGGCGNSCGSGGICINGVCSGNCAEGTICLANTYNPTTGQCEQVPAPSGTACGPNQVCNGSGACTTLTG